MILILLGLLLLLRAVRFEQLSSCCNHVRRGRGFDGSRRLADWLPFAAAVLLFFLCFQGLAYSFCQMKESGLVYAAIPVCTTTDEKCSQIS